MTDVEYSRDGTYFVVSTTGAYGGQAASNAGTSGCDVVTRFEDNATASSTPTWTAYTGSDTTWTVEVTDDVVYAGGHQKYQNNPSANNVAGPGAVSREGIAALDPVNGMPYSWNPTRARGVGVQDILATSTGLYVGSDTTLIGHTPGNTYHARIAFAAARRRQDAAARCQATTLPVNIYRVASGASQLHHPQLQRHHRRHRHQRAQRPRLGHQHRRVHGQRRALQGQLRRHRRQDDLQRHHLRHLGPGGRRLTSWSSRATGTPTSRR